MPNLSQFLALYSLFPNVSVTFLLVDETDHIVSKTEVSRPETPGVISVSLPSKARPLEIGKKYH